MLDIWLDFWFGGENVISEYRIQNTIILLKNASEISPLIMFLVESCKEGGREGGSPFLLEVPINPRDGGDIICIHKINESIL